MSIWVNVFCRKTVKNVTPDELINGIVKRFELLCYLYGEDEPEKFFPNIKSESRENENNFDIFLLNYEKESSNFIRLERWGDKGKVADELEEFYELISGCQDESVIKEYLDNTIETVGVELKLSDTEGLGWPIAIAAAAWLSDYADGIAYNSNDGWFLPTEKEVKFLIK